MRQEARENLSRPRVLSYDTRPSNNFFAGSEIGAILCSVSRCSYMCAGHRTPAALGVAMSPYGLRFHCCFASGKVMLITFQVARVACLHKEVRLLQCALIYTLPRNFPAFARALGCAEACRLQPPLPACLQHSSSKWKNSNAVSASVAHSFIQIESTLQYGIIPSPIITSQPFVL
jgi:hypothetical protein